MAFLRLYDLMMSPDSVWVTEDGGELWASDAYVLVRLSYIPSDRSIPDGPGYWEVRATRPPRRRQAAEKAQLRRLYEETVADYQRDPEAWHEIRWSAFTAASDSDKPIRIGSLNGTPVGIDANWYLRNKDQVYVYGKEPEGRWLVFRDDCWQVPIGIVMPIRLRKPVELGGPSLKHRQYQDVIKAIAALVS